MMPPITWDSKSFPHPDFRYWLSDIDPFDDNDRHERSFLHSSDHSAPE